MTHTIEYWQSWTAEQTTSRQLGTADTWFCPLHNFGLIRASGKDSFSFLNNQLSNQLSVVSDQQAQINAYCNPKGRTYCCFLVFMRDGNYYLRTTAELIPTVLKRLQMYVLRADVVLEYNSLAGIGIGGANSEKLIASTYGRAPAAPGEIIQVQEATIIRVWDHKPRYEIYAPIEYLMRQWKDWEQSASATETKHWSQQEILSGMPHLTLSSTEQFVPQMLNLDVLGGISFSKGCYPGQEVVSRTHYLGKLKRRMYRFSTDHQPVEIDMPIVVPAYSADQPSGKIIATYTDENKTTHGLAVMRMQGIDTSPIYIGQDKKASLIIEPLPYVVSEKSIDLEKTPS